MDRSFAGATDTLIAMRKQPRALVILGSGGMLGHVAALHFLEVYSGSIHCQAKRPTGIQAIDQNLTLLDVRETETFTRWLKSLGNVTVINAIAGKASRPGSTPDELLYLNATFPRLLADELDKKNNGSRLIQISSDGVFLGDKGSYTEKSVPDATDAYGFGKILGEVFHPPHLCIRTSLIGHSLVPANGLLDWFLFSKLPVEGYQKVFWNGVTTLELVRFLAYAVRNEITGLLHLGGDRLSKNDLLLKIREVYSKETLVTASDVPCIDRSLRSLRTDFNYTVPPVSAMLEEYRTWYSTRVIRGA